MAIISMRDASYAAEPMLCGDGSSFGHINYEVRSNAVQTGGSQSRAIGLPRHTFKLSLPSQMNQAAAGRWRALLMSLRGGVNHLEAYDPSHQFPTGSARGDRQTGGVAKGATYAYVNGTGTLKPGDWIQIGSGIGSSQLVMVTDAAVLPAFVNFTPPAFFNIPSNGLCRLDRPSTYFKLAGKIPEMGGVAGTTHLYGISVDFIEVFN